MPNANNDQLAAIARDAGHAAKDAGLYVALSAEEKAVFDHGVHAARCMIRAGIDKEAAQEAIDIMALHASAAISTLLAFIDETPPDESWVS